MGKLIRKPNLPDPDGFYAELLAAHQGLTDEESHAFNARALLILANHIGDRDALREALILARESRGDADRSKTAQESPGG